MKEGIDTPKENMGADIIRTIIKESGLSQREVAKRVGTSHSHIARLVNPNYYGHTTTTILRIAQEFGYKLKIELTTEDKT